MVTAFYILGLELLITVFASLIYMDYRRYKQDMRQAHKELVEAEAELAAAKEETSKVRAEIQAAEFERWIEETRDPESVESDNYHEPWIDQEEIDLTGPDPTELFDLLAMKAKKELQQFQGSLNAELPADHPKRKGE